MNVKKLMEALDDETNEKLFNYNSNILKNKNLEMIKQLHLTKKETLDIYRKLINYKYVEEVNDIKVGTFIRWIPIDDPDNIYLTKGAIFCEFVINNNGTISCVCKNFGFNTRYFQIEIEKNLIFQKLTEQELVILSALDHLSK